MLDKVLPSSLMTILNTKLDISKIYEIRFRINQPITINILGKIYFLCDNGFTKNITEALYADIDMINNIVYVASENSLYAVNNQLKEGFITIEGGIRLGIVGEAVYNGGKIETFNNINSINIRIPHEVNNCSQIAFGFLLDKSIKNTLILSPPGSGKTTFLRDIITQISKHNFALNCLVLDERYEIGGVKGGVPQLKLGCMTDIMSGIKKKDGFEFGIRSMGPNIIFTDEIANEKDISAIEYALSCGITVIATTHCDSMAQLRKKQNFKSLLDIKLFERYVVLSSRNGAGTIEGIYNENFGLMYRE